MRKIIKLFEAAILVLFAVACNDHSIDIGSNAVVGPPKFAYVTQYTSGVSICSVDSVTGALTNCADAGGDSILDSLKPQGIVLDSSESNAYITDYQASEAAQCVINPVDGSFSSCSSTVITSPSGYAGLYGMLTLNAAGSTAFIVDDGEGGRVLACPISGAAISSSCTDTGASGFAADPSEIVLNRSGNRAYIASYDNDGMAGVVTDCSVSGSSFSSCTNKNGDGTVTFTGPSGVALNNDESIIYVPDFSAGKVYGCSTSGGTSTTFSHCFTATTLSANEVWGITLNASNTFAYVTSWTSNIYVCPILGDGTFGTCAPSSGFSYAVDITFKY